MRPKFLAGVVVGLLLVYLSLFGLSGFGLAVLPGTPENFTTYTEVDSAGYLSVTASSVTVTAMPRSATSYLYKDFGNAHFADFHMQFEAQCTAVQIDTGMLFLVLANNIGTSVQMSDITIGFGLGANSSGYYFVLGDGRVSGGSTSWKITGVATGLYYFDLTRTNSLITLEVFSSLAYASPIATLTCAVSDGFRYLYVSQSLGVVGSTLTASGKVQNLVIGGGGATYSDVTISVSGQGTTVPAAGHYATTYYVGGSLTITATPASGWSFDYMTRNGVISPSMTLTSLGATEVVVVYFKSGGPTTGTLQVFASYNGAYVVASVTASGPQIVSGSTTASAGITWTVLAGTYIVSGTYSSGSATPQTVTVPAGGAAPPVTLNFGGSPPTPDFLALIKAFFDLFIVKSLFLVSGLISTIVSGIMFILPAKDERRRTAPPPYAYY